MTANAGQTSTKIPIVINNLNNDSSSSSDSDPTILLQDVDLIQGRETDSDYIAVVPVPTEWKSQLIAPETVRYSERSKSSTTAIAPTKPLHAPIWTRTAIKLFVAVRQRKHATLFRRRLRGLFEESSHLPAHSIIGLPHQP